MVRTENIESKLSSLRSYLDLLERYRSRDIEEIRSDPDLRGATERYLFLATQSAIDAAEMYCKLKDLGKPDSMARAFELLYDSKVIDSSLRDAMVRMVGFRNALSHGYENLDYTIVEGVLVSGLSDLERLIQAIQSVL